jgi:thioredoxin-related protein
MTTQTRRATLAALFALTSFADLASAQDKPHANDPVDKPQVYDQSADANADITAALVRAKSDNTRVLVQYGANWCGWCVLLDGLCKSDRKIAHALLYEYELVKVDVDRFDKHMDVAAKYGPGEKLKATGIPLLVVLDSSGKVLVNQETGSLEKGKAHDPEKVLAFLDKWKAEPRDARDVLKKGLAAAREQNKRVFLHFGAPWCAWCGRLDTFLARESITELMAVDYIDLKIDIDRMIHGKDLEKEFRKDDGGIPWYAILDADGNVLATADGPQGNIGFPVTQQEISHFITTIDGTRRNLNPEQVQSLRDALTENGNRILAEMNTRRAAQQARDTPGD